jgi:3-dehydrosphinganine reductase
MAAQKIKGTIILTSSLVGLFGLIGYSAYSPAKFGLRGEILLSFLYLT